MIKLRGYTKFEQFLDLPHVLILRAVSESTKENVLIKVLRSEYPTADELALFETEFGLLSQDLGDGTPKVIERVQVDKIHALVIEDIGGQILQNEIAERKMTVAEILDLSILIVKALGRIQERDIIHGNIRPANIVFNRRTERLQIIDFGLASTALQYFSPEQTGRTQRSVDYRSDYYSLGVTLYQLFSGQLPFKASDEMEWIHSHIAQTETPLHILNSQVPKPISLIVQKLMKKSADERYQSCLGILSDLQSCRELVNQGLGFDGFTPGTKDISAVFRLSTKLYGRENEVHLVNDALAKTILGSKRMILVGGEPGVGKTTIANVIKESAKSAQGYFIFGKYDQFRKDVPFSALITAFNQLVGQILAEDEQRIQGWKTRLSEALGANAGVVTAILPHLKLILGEVPEVQELDGKELKHRFHLTFHNFIRACCVPGRPLVIFLDDLQWADSASRSLLQTFLSENEATSLLVVGAYRDNQVQAGHPILQLFRDLEETKLAIDKIFLTRLNQTDIKNLLVDSFRAKPTDCESLAQLVFSKTEGNPFFVTQFLKNLHERHLLRFGIEHGWHWDIEELKKQEVTSNVLDLLRDKIFQLPEETRSLLTLASCFGNYFRVEELKTYNQKTDSENVALLEPAARNGLINAADSGAFKFIHDRVQEAAYNILNAEQRQKIHWQIANRLLSIWDEAKIRAEIFYLVNHWNAGSGLVESEQQRVKSAELNLIAATTARESAVNDLAYTYSLNGLSLLNSEDWKAHEKYLRPLTMLRALSEFALGKLDEAEKSFKTLLKKVKDPVLKAPVYCSLVVLYNLRENRDEGIEWGRKGLAELGVRIPRKPWSLSTIILVLRARFEVNLFLKNPWIESPTPQVQSSHEIMAIFSSLAIPMFQYRKDLLAYSGMRGLLISLKERFLEINGRSFLVALVWSRFHNFAEAKRMGDYIISWFNRPDLNTNGKRALYVLGGFSMPFLYSLKEAVTVMERGMAELHQAGDLIYTSGCAQYIAGIALFSESKLARAEARMNEMRDFSLQLNNPFTARLIEQPLHVVKALKGDYPSPLSLSPDGTPESVIAERLSQDEAPAEHGYFILGSILLKYIMADFKSAYELALQADAPLKIVPFASMTIITRGLITRMNIKFSARASRKDRKELRFFKKLSDHNPNYKALYSMMLAEDLWSQKRISEACSILSIAVKDAQQSEMPFFQALANEQLAEYFFAQNLEKAAHLHLREALFFYENWGAAGKVQRLSAEYPELVAMNQNSLSGSGSAQLKSPNVSLDINTVLKASNTLTSEMDMTKLVHKLLNILIENAGAERGVLIVNTNDKLIVRGQRHVRDTDEFKLSEIPVEGYADISRSVLSYVARTQETVVMADASTDDRVSRDEYVQRAKVLSTVCLPIVSQGELKGMVYLENNAATAVFSPDRVELMKTLAGQIAISIENASLYQQQAETIRMQNELATAQTVQEMLFPKADFESEHVSIAGYYRPATECGGDWWYYSQIGDWNYIWIGDATGHGAPAALVTSAACSAVAILEASKDITPESAMAYLNQAIYRTTKGKINMTFFVGALNSKTGEFKFVRASHDPPYLIRNAKKSTAASFAEFRELLEPLQGINGRRLGEYNEEVYEAKSIQLEPGDTILFYTDGLPDVVNPEERAWSERGFLKAFYESINHSPKEMTAYIVQKADDFGRQKELADDITICVMKYLGTATQSGKKAA